MAAPPQPSSALFLSVLSVGEIRRGIEALAASRRRLALLDWLETNFRGSSRAGCWLSTWAWQTVGGAFPSAARRSLPVVYSLLAATAMHHGLTMVTRNARNFADVAGLEVIDPWQVLSDPP